VDKPLAHTPADVRKIVAAAATSGARVCVAQDYRYKPGAQKVKALLEAGRAGRLSNVTVQFIGSAPFVAHTFYGGLDGPKAIGLEMGIHHFDMMRWFLGREPCAVEARSWRPPWGYGTADTTLQALVEFGDELRATYAADWNSKAEHTSWNGRWSMAGERADVLWDDAPDGTVDVRLVRRGKTGPIEQRFSPKAKRYSMHLLIKAFADAVKSGGPMPVPLDDNVRSMGLALAAVESCRRRKEIDVPRVMEKEGLSCR
jgi:predicted dehydrogenase